MNTKGVTVIIPAKNEENSIEKIVNFAKKSNIVNQIIVVDNSSTDKTYEIAQQLNIEVIKCPKVGKGYAMQAGLYIARNDVIVFLDADIENYLDNTIELLSKPILDEKCDFVKSTFDRTTGGLVTEITVKPLLQILFPNMHNFSEPISGMIGCKKEILDNLNFENDYGVDIGILIDIVNGGYKFKEMNIGKISNNSHLSKNIEKMKKMSLEVMSAIIKRSNINKNI